MTRGNHLLGGSLVFSSVLVLGLACFAVAFDDGPSLRTDAPAYDAGDTLTLVLHNGADQTVVTHPTLCGAVLERETGSGWRWSRPYTPFVVCTAMAAMVDPGDSIVARRALPSELAGNRYRFRAEVTLRRTRDRVVLETEPFRVR